VFNLSRLSLFPRRKETTDRHISPLGLMCLQGEEMKIDVKNIEEEFQFHGLQAGKSPPEYWYFSDLLKYQISIFDFLFFCSSF
jgi:hypothetical protein